MQLPLVEAARAAQVHPRDVARAVDAGDLDAAGRPDADPHVEVTELEVLDMQRYVWHGALAWAVENGQELSLVRQAIRDGLLIGIDSPTAGAWVLEPIPAYASGRLGLRVAN